MEWKHKNIQAFWGEIASSEHVLQIYEKEKIFIDTLEGFTGSGFIAGDSVVVIATREHLYALEERLEYQNFDIETLKKTSQYIPVETGEMLLQVTTDGNPDEKKFNTSVNKLLKQASKGEKKVRAYGEMVAVLCKQGRFDAALQLEKLWNKTCHTQSVRVFCAYPKNLFNTKNEGFLTDICGTHTTIIDGSSRPSTEIYYKSAPIPQTD